MSKRAKEKLFSMDLAAVNDSSVGGQALTITHPMFGVVAALVISVPQPHFDYRTVAGAVTKALMNGHVSARGVTLVLPVDILPKRERTRKQPVNWFAPEDRITQDDGE